MLCSSSGVSVLSVKPAGTRTSELVETRGFVHLANITPRYPPPLAGLDRFTSAACPSGRQLWVVASTGTLDQGWLVSSSDGGSHWTATRQLWSGSGGVGSVGFVNGANGFLVAGNPTESSSAVSLSRTTDGGSTWETVRVTFRFLAASQFRVPSFATATAGFTVETSLSSAAGSAVQSTVLTTTDAGSGWTPVKLPVPKGKEVLYEQPQFFGPDGIVPAVVVEPTLRLDPLSSSAPGGTGRVVLEHTADTGRSWKSWPAVPLTVPVELGEPGNGDPGTLYGAPSVSVANRSTVWVAGIGRSGQVDLRVARDGGARWLPFSPSRGSP